MNNVVHVMTGSPPLRSG